jgi:ubiquinone/menaquinone biosynthesis C-methylase UbiE
MYNAIAEHYNAADQFGAISKSHEVAIDQLKKTPISRKKSCKVLDLGVGDGAFLLKLTPFLNSPNLTGIDISKEMLNKANQVLPINPIETSAASASHFLPHHSQDLVLAHFINAYIPIKTLFHEANILTRANGYFSLITTTYDSFPQAQAYLTSFINQDTLLSNIVGHYYKSIVKNTTVAASEDDLKQAFKTHEFQIVEHQRLSIPITLNNIEELTTFGIDGTWFLNTLSIKILPKKFLIARLQRLFTQIFTFPYHDTHVIDVVLAKK